MATRDRGTTATATAATSTPMIGAGRFLLRPYEPSDAQEMAAAVRESVDSVGRWMTWAKPDFSVSDAACWFDACSQARDAGSAHEFGMYSADGRYVGGCGLNQFSTLNRFCNLGYWVRRSRQREGAATAAIFALRRLALDGLGQSRVEIIVAEGNDASLAVARRAGATLECLAQNRLQLHGRAVAAHVLSFTD